MASLTGFTVFNMGNLPLNDFESDFESVKVESNSSTERAIISPVYLYSVNIFIYITLYGVYTSMRHGECSGASRAEDGDW